MLEQILVKSYNLPQLVAPQLKRAIELIGIVTIRPERVNELFTQKCIPRNDIC